MYFEFEKQILKNLYIFLLFLCIIRKISCICYIISKKTTTPWCFLFCVSIVDITQFFR